MDLMEFSQKITLDDSEFKSGMTSAKNGLSTIGSVGSSIFAGIGKAAVAGLGIATAGVTALTKSAVGSYGDYEQLKGGIETLFGSSSNTMMNYANDAYKTAQMSANDYMSLATSFSASLLQSVGGDTAKASEYANSAIIDMSDNANKMGTDIESIQNAYQGFSKQNYTMLDNLKLGYGGTKEEMQRLLDDAQKISGVKYDLSSYADVTQAIHVMQQEMGIAGTSSKEAGATIQGSMAMTKSAIKNLMTGLGDSNADIGGLFSNLVTSASGLIDNLIPVITNVLNALPNVINQAVPILTSKLPELVNQIIPALMTASQALLDALIQNLPALFTTITIMMSSAMDFVIQNLPMIINMGLQLIITLADAIVNSLPTLIPAIIQCILTIVNMLTNQDTLTQLITSALTIITSFADGIINAIPQLIPALIDCILTIVDQLTNPDTLLQLIDSGIQLVIALALGLVDAIPQIVGKIPEIIDNLITALVGAIPMLIEAGIKLFVAIVQNLPAIIAGIIKAIPQIITSLIEGFGSFAGKMGEIGLNLIKGIWNGISDATGWLLDKIKGFGGKVLDGIKSFFGIHSPSTVFRDQIGKNLALGLGEGFTDEMDSVTNKMNKAVPTSFTTRGLVSYGEPLVNTAQLSRSGYYSNSSNSSNTYNNTPINIRGGDIIINGSATEKTVSQTRRAQREELSRFLGNINRLQRA